MEISAEYPARNHIECFSMPGQQLASPSCRPSASGISLPLVVAAAVQREQYMMRSSPVVDAIGCAAGVKKVAR